MASPIGSNRSPRRPLSCRAERVSFSRETRDRCDAHGIDIDLAYRQMLLEIRVGGPVYQRLASGLWHDQHRWNGRGRVRRHEQQRNLGTMSASTTGILTASETDILEKLACGLTEKQVARERWTQHSTVNGQIKMIRRKLDARTAAHAVAIALRAGLIRPPAR